MVSVKKILPGSIDLPSQDYQSCILTIILKELYVLFDFIPQAFCY